MYKTLLIGSAIIVLLLISSILFNPSQDHHKDSIGNLFIPLSKQEAVLNFKQKDIFTFLNNKEDSIFTFQIIGNPSDKVNYQIQKRRLKTNEKKSMEDLFESTSLVFASSQSSGLNNTEIDSLLNQNFQDRKKLFKNALLFDGRRYLDAENKSVDLWSKIDDSVFVFILLSIVPLLILLFQDLLVHFLKAKSYSKTHQGIQLLMLFLTLLFFYNMVTPDSYAASNISAIIKYSLLFFSIYYIYQYLLKNKLKEASAAGKSIILFAIAIVCSLGSTLLVRLIDFYIFNSDNYTILAQRPIYFELGFLFSFCLANFFNNVRRSFFQKRKKLAN